MDNTRHFPVPSLESSSNLPHHHTIITSLSSQCWQHYYNQSSNFDRQYHSIYIGSLGPCAFVRYRLALSIEDRDQKLQLLHDASKAVQNVLLATESADSSRQRVTLLEGERIGALALSSAFYYAHYTCTNSNLELLEVSTCKREILEIGSRYVKTLPAEECEVLYGRAGYLRVIAFVRCTTNDPEFGKDVVKVIVQQIIHEGQRVAARSRTTLPLLWKWHGKEYLGAIHGVVGILHTLLCFYDEVSLVKGAIEMIKLTTIKLDDLCFPSGNLKSSLESNKDRLVHLCHGSPGHILLLVKAYEVFGDEDYLNRAEQIGTSVLCKRGLLKKGKHLFFQIIHCSSY